MNEESTHFVAYRRGRYLDLYYMETIFLAFADGNGEGRFFRGLVIRYPFNYVPVEYS